MCSGLTAIVVENDNNVYDSRGDCCAIVRTADNVLIAGCQNSVIPNSVTSIGPWAFQGCSGLTSITIPNSVTSIGRYAFWCCSGLTSVIVERETPLEIDESVFDNSNYKNSTLYVPKGTKAAYEAASVWKDFGTIEEVWFVADGAFSDSQGIQYIANDDFYTCYVSGHGKKYCSELVIPQYFKGCQVTSIGDRALDGCSGLTSITIPNSVTDIGGSAFQNCSGLTSVIIEWETPLEIDESVFDNSNYKNATLYVPKGTKAAYEVASVWKNFRAIEEFWDNTEGALSDSQGIRYSANDDSYTCYVSGHDDTYASVLVIPSFFKGRQVKSIRQSAFLRCRVLTTITIPNSVTSIGNSAFSGCSALTSITIPESVTSIGGSAFSGCSGLTAISIPNSVTSIGNDAFDGCSGLTSITIPNSVTSIGGSAFRNCSGMTSLTIPNSVTSIGNDAFGGCSGLTSILVEWETPLEIESSVFNSSNYNYAILYVPKGSKAAYEAAHVWQNFGIIKEYQYEVIYQSNFTIDGDDALGAGWIVSADINDSNPDPSMQPANSAAGNRLQHDKSGFAADVLYLAQRSALAGIALYGTEEDHKLTLKGGKTYHLTLKTAQWDAYHTSDDPNRTLRVQVLTEDAVNTEDGTIVDESGIIAEDFNLTNGHMHDTNGISSDKEYTAFDIAFTPESDGNFVIRLVAGNKDGNPAGYGDGNAIADVKVESIIIIYDVETTDISALDNVIYMESFEATKGKEVDVPLMMKNTAGIRGFQFDMQLPIGVTVAKNENGRLVSSLNTRRLPEGSAHTLTVNELEDGTVRFLCGSQYDETLTGTEGEIITVRLCVDRYMLDGQYPIVLKNVKLTETNISKYYLTETVQTALTVIPYTPGDISGDGEIDVTDYIGVANHIMGNTPAGFVVAAADVNKDQVVDVSDYIGIANLILYNSVYGNTGANASRRAQRRGVTDVSLLDNVIYLEPFAAEPGGEVQLKLKMKNTAAIRGFQFDLYLPEGMTAKKYANGRIVSSLNDARRPDGDEHTLTLSERPDGAIRFLCGSQYDETFTGSDGEIATLTINVSADMGEDDYAVYLRHVKLTETDISKYYLTEEIETTAMVTRSPWLPGDATEDGDVNVTDIMAVANWILKIKMDKFNLLAADVNGDGDINVTDIMGIANIILKVTPSSNSRAVSVADAVEPQ